MNDNDPENRYGVPDEVRGLLSPDDVREVLIGEVSGQALHKRLSGETGAHVIMGALSDTAIQAVIVPPPPTISIRGTDGQPLISVHPDGRHEFGENYEPDDAAKGFWEAVERFAPSPMVWQFGAPLTATINAELARGEAADKLLHNTQRVHEAVHAALGETRHCPMCDHAAEARALLERKTL
ncbi:hypothetical protein ACIP9H_33855 [Streptomyces sp. NPDC088732]|uniref:hypothetical protein n=1 Tax=Streptomyces sp. NPDC088732 TaxID=3365879 RepID=UPI0037FD6693